jgi:hypothetical protein
VGYAQTGGFAMYEYFEQARAHVCPACAVGWGTLSLINAGLAQAKNRSGLSWWLVSLFLGPITTFIIVILDKLPEPTAFREPE